MELKKFILSQELTIREAMQCIEENARGIIFVCDGIQLRGTVTDGDIRRYILSDGNLQASVGSIMNKNPLYLYKDDKQEAQEFMRKNVISAVPIVDKEKNVKDIIFFFDKEEKYKSIQAPLVIMAGGKGTRLKPYTDILPKPLIPIGKQTIVEHIIEKFEKYQCMPIYMIINYKKNFIKSYFMDAEQKRSIQFVEEEEFLGTGGGLQLLKGVIKEDFFLTNCDILVEGAYSKMMEYHRKSQSIITLICAQKKIVIPYGTIQRGMDGYAKSILEKPQYDFLTNTGFYIINPSFLDLIPSNSFIHITDIIQKCISEDKRVGVYIVEEDAWMDMGQIEELEKMKNSLM